MASAGAWDWWRGGAADTGARAAAGPPPVGAVAKGATAEDAKRQHSPLRALRRVACLVSLGPLLRTPRAEGAPLDVSRQRGARESALQGRRQGRHARRRTCALGRWWSRMLRAPAPGRRLGRRPSARSRRGQQQKTPNGNIAPFAPCAESPAWSLWGHYSGRQGPREPPLTFPANAAQGRARCREDVKDGTPAGGPVLWGGGGLPPLTGGDSVVRGTPQQREGWRAKVARLHWHRSIVAAAHRTRGGDGVRARRRGGATAGCEGGSWRTLACARGLTEWPKGREAAGVPGEPQDSMPYPSSPVATVPGGRVGHGVVKGSGGRIRREGREVVLPGAA